MPQDAKPSLDKEEPPKGSPSKAQLRIKEYLSLLQPCAVATLAVLCWYLIITRGPMFFLALLLVVFLGYVLVHRPDRGQSDYYQNQDYVHWAIALSIVGSIVYGFFQLNEANTHSRHADVVVCSAFRGSTSWNGTDVWKIKTQRGDFVVQGGLYNGKTSDDDAAAHGFNSGSVYRITYHGGNGNDRYMTDAELIAGNGTCGSSR